MGELQPSEMVARCIPRVLLGPCTLRSDDTSVNPSGAGRRVREVTGLVWRQDLTQLGAFWTSCQPGALAALKRCPADDHHRFSKTTFPSTPLCTTQWLVLNGGLSDVLAV